MLRNLIDPDDARDILRACGVPFGADYHTLRSETVDALLAAADRCRYRTPRNANGSRARCWHDYLQRRARRED